MQTQERPYNGAYAGEYLNHVAFPLGGMGAGMICCVHGPRAGRCHCPSISVVRSGPASSTRLLRT